MRQFSDPDVVKTTEVFLIPSSFLVAALGTADTNPHRAAVSLIGLVVSVLWLVCSREALAELMSDQPGKEAAPLSRRIKIMSSLPVFFILCWTASLIAHAMLWGKPLGSELIP